MPEPHVQSGFKVPPEVPRYFAGRRLKPAFSWLDVWGEEHAYAFTVAKAVDVELLTLFRDSIAGAIARGEGFETWRAGLVPELHRLGWCGPRPVADPEGRAPDEAVDFTSPRRLRTLFSANLRSARAAGQWERIQRTKDALPDLLYVRTSSAKPRPQHLAWAGTILPADDPFWTTHFPPNGWQCKCAVRQISRFERARKLAEPGYSAERPASPERTFVNRRTGAVVRVPDGIDPGWAHNPGLARVRTLVASLSERLETAGTAKARQTIAEIWETPLPRIVSRLPPSERVQVPVALAPGAAEALDARSALVSVSRDTLAEKLGRHRDRPTEVASFAKVQALIDEGRLVDRGQDNRRSIVTEQFDGWWNTVVARSAAGFLRIVSVHRLRAAQALKWLSGNADGRP